MLVSACRIFPDWAEIANVKVKVFRELLRSGHLPPPILLRINNFGRLMIVDGNNRFLAAVEEGHTEIEAGIIDANGAYCL